MSEQPRFSREDRYASLSVDRFAKWWLSNRPIQPPSECLSQVGGLVGIVLYREGPFQVQLYMTPGRVDIPSHTHPNVESIEMHLSGVVELSIRGSEMQGRDSLNGYLKVGSHDDHYGYMENGSFYSFQKWTNGSPLAGISMDWAGTPVDQTHAQQLMQ